MRKSGSPPGRTESATPAEYGQLPHAIRRELHFLQIMNKRRRESLAPYVGLNRATPLLTEILRAIALAYTHDRCLRIREVVEICSSYGSSKTIREAIQILVDKGLAAQVRREGDGRAVYLCATQRVVDLYRSEVPWLRREFHKLLREFPI